MDYAEVRDLARSVARASRSRAAPVLAVTKAKDFDEAIRFANDTDYGLTGTVYSKSETSGRPPRTSTSGTCI